MLSTTLPYTEFQSLGSSNCPGEKGEVCFVSRTEVYCHSAKLCPQNISWFGFVPHTLNYLLNTHSQQLVLATAARIENQLGQAGVHYPQGSNRDI